MSKLINVMSYAYEAQRATKKGKFTVNDVLQYLGTTDPAVRKSISNVLNQNAKRAIDEINVVDTAISAGSNRTVNVFKITPIGADVIKANRDRGYIVNKEELIAMLQTTNSNMGRKTNAAKGMASKSVTVIPRHQQFAPAEPVVDNMSEIAESLVDSTTKLLHQNKFYRDLLLDVCMKLADSLNMKVVDKNFQPPQFLTEQNGDLFSQGDSIDG